MSEPAVPSGAAWVDRRVGGVCLIRMEPEVDRMLITVTTELYERGVAGRSHRAPARHFTDPALALRAVAAFLFGEQHEESG